jgi:hypothetical protein
MQFIFIACLNIYLGISFQYPHLVHGAIASSAPVRALVDFQGYNDVVAASLAAPIVNGSERVCLTKCNYFHCLSLSPSSSACPKSKKLSIKLIK